MFTKEEVIEAMRQCLDEKEKEILSARWGINTGIPIRFEEINEIYGITIEQMRDIEKRVDFPPPQEGSLSVALQFHNY